MEGEADGEGCGLGVGVGGERCWALGGWIMSGIGIAIEGEADDMATWQGLK